jgi:hypothetical protein
VHGEAAKAAQLHPSPFTERLAQNFAKLAHQPVGLQGREIGSVANLLNQIASFH